MFQIKTLAMIFCFIVSIMSSALGQPSQDKSKMAELHRETLFSVNTTQEEKITAINALQLMPASQSSNFLQDVAYKHPNLYMRERAIMALTQIRDPEAIPTLVEIGLNPPSSEVKLAAYNAVWVLRQTYPIPDPPVVTLDPISSIQLGQEFDVEATIVSPVDRENVKIRFGWGKLLYLRKTEIASAYEGPLVAGKPVLIRGRFLVNEIGKTLLVLTVHINLNKVDTTTYRYPLYIDIRKDKGLASMTPFPEWD